jgi:hypothetical protein
MPEATTAAATCPRGLAVCHRLWVPASYLDTAVLDGIKKRLEWAASSDG